MTEEQYDSLVEKILTVLAAASQGRYTPAERAAMTKECQSLAIFILTLKPR